VENVGPLALVGGEEWHDGCSFDRALLEVSGADEVVVLATAAAYEHPRRAEERAAAWFGDLGVESVALPVYARSDAEDAELCARVASARFVYLGDGSTLHLRSVVKDSPLWAALLTAWRSGAVVAGSSAGAMVLGDPMVDPRGGAFTLGLGLVHNLAVVPHWERWTADKSRRMLQLIPQGAVAAEIQERTALIRWSDGRWEAAGAGSVSLTLDRRTATLEELEEVVR
jgi:cyanophycinase